MVSHFFELANNFAHETVAQTMNGQYIDCSQNKGLAKSTDKEQQGATN